MDERLLEQRRAGVPWSWIAAELELGRVAVIERARRLGIAAHETVVTRQPASQHACYDRGESPLPPGHPISWHMLVALTPSIDATWPGCRS